MQHSTLSLKCCSTCFTGMTKYYTHTNQTYAPLCSHTHTHTHTETHLQTHLLTHCIHTLTDIQIQPIKHTTLQIFNTGQMPFIHTHPPHFTHTCRTQTHTHTTLTHTHTHTHTHTQT